jgi:hypothetical protein
MDQVAMHPARWVLVHPDKAILLNRNVGVKMVHFLASLARSCAFVISSRVDLVEQLWGLCGSQPFFWRQLFCCVIVFTKFRSSWQG